MTNSIQYLTDEQLDFIEQKFGIDEHTLLLLSEDELYDKVYDPCCIVEEVETVNADSSDAPLSDDGRIAADIVTLLGNYLDD